MVFLKIWAHFLGTHIDSTIQLLGIALTSIQRQFKEQIGSKYNSNIIVGNYNVDNKNNDNNDNNTYKVIIVMKVEQ